MYILSISVGLSIRVVSSLTTQSQYVVTETKGRGLELENKAWLGSPANKKLSRRIVYLWAHLGLAESQSGLLARG